MRTKTKTLFALGAVAALAALLVARIAFPHLFVKREEEAE